MSVRPQLKNFSLESSVLASLGAAVIATSTDGEIIFWNSCAADLYGWTASEVLGRNISELIVPDPAQEEAAEIMRLLASGKSWSGEFTVSCKDGRQFTAWVTDTPLLNDSGQMVGVVGVSYDLTPAKKAEAELRASEEQFKRLANVLPGLCWISRPDGYVTWYSQRFYDYTGLTLHDTEGWGWQTLHDPELLPTVVERWQTSLATGAPFDIELKLRGRDGVLRWFIARAMPFRASDGHIVNWFGVCTDIDDVVMTRQALHEAQRNLETRVEQRTSQLNLANENLQALSARLLQSQDDERRRLARELHDSLGQLIAATSMYLGMVSRRSQIVDDTAASAMTQAMRLVEEMGRQIRTISHLLHPPLLDEVGLATALRLYVEEFSARSGIQVQLDISDGFQRASADLEIAVFRIVQEALTNIHRHSGSSVARILVEQSATRLNLRLEDRGRGISDEKLSQIRSARLGGVGFRGMQERVRQLGGSWEITSDHTGTVVIASLPLHQ